MKKRCFLCQTETTGFIRQTWGFICKKCCQTRKAEVNELDVNEKQRRKLMNLK